MNAGEHYNRIQKIRAMTFHIENLLSLYGWWHFTETLRDLERAADAWEAQAAPLSSADP